MNDYVLELSEAELARYRMMAEAAARREREWWAQAGITDGAAVADVGCGPGAVSVALARVVGASGKVYAVDRDPVALAAAQRAATDAGLSNVVTSEGSATATGLSTESVDVVMMRHVLAHNGGREQEIVDHLSMLARSGGAVYIVDTEATAMRVHPREGTEALLELTTRYQQFHQQLGNDLSVGLRLGDLLERAGLEQVEHHGDYQVVRAQPGMRPPPWAARDQMRSAGVLSDDDIERYEHEFARLDRGEIKVTLFIPTFMAWARKPR